MLAYPIAAAVLLLGQGAAAKKSRRRLHPEKPNFLRMMDGHREHAQRKSAIEKLQGKLRDGTVEKFTKELRGDTERSAELRQKIIERSTVVKPPGGGGRRLQNNNDDAAAAANDDAAAANDYSSSSYNAADGAYNYASENNGKYVYDQNGNVQYKYDRNNDGTDDFFQSNTDWNNAFGFDPTQFSMSYHRCASVRQYDDEIASMEDTDGVFATKTFAVFRFCPAKTCMGWEAQTYQWSCDSDVFGKEYCQALSAYMGVMEEMNKGHTSNGGWNGYNGGRQQANNWMYQNYAKYTGNQAYDENGQPYGYPNDNEDYEKCDCSEENKSVDCEAFCVGTGARGEGCQSNYGEYMMEMEEYLELMLDWQEERFDDYCDYCEECMFDVYEYWLVNSGNGYENNGNNGYYNKRKLEFEDFMKMGGRRKLANNNADEWQEYQNYYEVCPEYDTCTQYYNMCQEGMDEEFTDYLECNEAQTSSGQEVYIGPHCADDGFTLTLGVYQDQYCNDYIGSGLDISKVMDDDSISVENDPFKPYYNSHFGPTLGQLKYVNEDNVCIPCAESDLLWVDVDYNNGNDDDERNGGGNGNVNGLCESAYKVAARCDKHYRSYNSRSQRAKYQQAVAQTDLTCDFIDSIVMGNYDESGEIGTTNLSKKKQFGNWLANKPYTKTAGQVITRVSPFQIFSLVASILAVCVLAMWSMSLRGSLTKAWRPRRGLRGHTHVQTDVTRQNSGITMGRGDAPAVSTNNSGIMMGRSEGSYYMS